MRKYEILLVLSEEDLWSLRDISSALENRGYQITTAVNNGSATEMLHTKDFDLVITSFLDVLKKAKDVNPETMVLILSDTCKVTFAIKALRLHADDCILKPLDLVELRNLVAHYLEKLELKRRDSQSESHEGELTCNSLNMLKMMFHDLRGSLVSMSATLKLLTRGYYGKMDEGVTNHLNELLSKTISLNGMTEEYLSRAFSVDGDLEIEDEALDLKQDIIDPILEELSPELREHCIRVEHRFDEMSTRPISIKANRFWWKTVFRNLLKNAIKYGNPGGTIAIGFENQGSFYRLNVYNSGQPIPEEYRNKIFKKFMSFGKNGNGGANGMGLGLYLVKEIIRKHGGDIWYQAEEGGSNFVFTLPSGSAFSTDLLLPIKPAQPRLSAVRLQKMEKEVLDQKAY